jgi:hypothetical protein
MLVISDYWSRHGHTGTRIRSYRHAQTCTTQVVGVEGKRDGEALPAVCETPNIRIQRSSSKMFALAPVSVRSVREQEINMNVLRTDTQAQVHEK